MKLYIDLQDEFVCDTHASEYVKENIPALTTLEVWDLMVALQTNYKNFCVYCREEKVA